MNQGEVLAWARRAEVQTHPGVIEAYLGSVDDVQPASLRREAGMSTAARTCRHQRGGAHQTATAVTDPCC